MNEIGTREPLGQAVRRLLTERGVSLRGLAREAGISHCYLFRVLEGKQPPSDNLLRRVTVALGLPEDYFREVRLRRIIEAAKADDSLADWMYGLVLSRQ